MAHTNNEINEARKAYFENISKKNLIDHTRLDQLDIDNIGIVLNYQQIALMQLAIKNNKKSYDLYQKSLTSLEDVMTEKGKKETYLAVLQKLIGDEDIPEMSNRVIIDIYNQSKNNPDITSDMVKNIMVKFISKLSTNLQTLIYKKIKSYGETEYDGIKKMSLEEALKLFSYVDQDYTAITINDVGRYSNYMLLNGMTDRDRLKDVLAFAYENDKQVRISSLISNQDFPPQFVKMSKEELKTKLLTYVDDITKYISLYNISHQRTDRKPFIESITCFEKLLTTEGPYNYNMDNWQKLLTIEDLCDIIKVARNNLPDIDFIYDENFLESKEKRKAFWKIIKQINDYEEKNQIKLINIIGTKMHVDLDATKTEIEDMLQDLGSLSYQVSITEFNVSPSIDMLENNSQEEIEILRERFISDLCNTITHLGISKKVAFNSVTIGIVSDSQSFITSLVNKKRENEGKTLLTNTFSGMYDSNMERKFKESKVRGRKKIEVSNEKGSAETIYIGIIVMSLLIVVSLVIYFFLKYI